MASEPPVELGYLRRVLGGLDPLRDPRAAPGLVEERQLVRPPAEHGNAQRLEKLGRGGNVEERLDSRADDQRLGTGELTEVGGDVGKAREAAVHSSEPAGPH